MLGLPALAPAQPGASGGPIFRVRVRDTGSTVVSIRRLEIDHGFGSQCEPLLVAEFAHGADGPQNVQVVKLGFISRRFEGHAFRVETDSAAYELGVLRPLDFVEDTICRWMPPKVGVEVDRATYLAIVRSTRVVLQVGERSIRLTREHLDVLRALAAELARGG